MAEQISSLYNSVTESVAAALSPPAAPAAGKHKFLLYGKNGWIGGMLIELARANGDEVVLGDARLDLADVRAQLRDLGLGVLWGRVGSGGVGSD